MVSLLPQLLYLAPFSAFLIRIAVGIVLVSAAWKHYSGPNKAQSLAFFEAVVAAVIIAGAWTQAGAIAAAMIIVVWLMSPSLRPVAQATALLAFVMCLSLLVTGAGAVAFDLPL